MKGRITAAIVFIFIAVIAVSQLPLLNTEHSQVNPDERDRLLEPTYKVANLTSNLFDESGARTHSVKALNMEHYEALGFMVFEQPRYTIYMDDGSYYTISADEGTWYSDDRVDLETNIVINSQKDDGFIQQITADYITLNLDTKALRSDQPIVLKGDDFTMLSNGLEANLATQQYALLEHVKTEFLPHQQSEK